MNLIMTMIFMKIPLKFQVLLQQSCLVDGGLNTAKNWYTCRVVAVLLAVVSSEVIKPHSF